MKNNENIITKIKKKDNIKFSLGTEFDDILSCVYNANLLNS